MHYIIIIKFLKKYTINFFDLKATKIQKLYIKIN